MNDDFYVPSVINIIIFKYIKLIFLYKRIHISNGPIWGLITEFLNNFQVPMIVMNMVNLHLNYLY